MEAQLDVAFADLDRGWHVAADANNADQMYPDQSLYTASSVPDVVRRINRAFQRADQIQHLEGRGDVDFFAPIIADAAGVHFEDQLAAEKKCSHLGGKVLVPMSQFVRTLNAARLAADIEGVPTVLFARTDADSAQLLISDVDPRDQKFLTGERTAEGFFRVKPGAGKAYAIARGIAFAEYADLVWWETSEPNLDDARRFADAIHHHFPD